MQCCSLKNVAMMTIRYLGLKHTTLYYYGKYRTHRDSATHGVLGWASCFFFFHETLFFLTWKCLIGTLFFSDLGIWQTSSLKNEWREPVSSRKTTDSAAASAKIWAFKQKLDFWKTCIHCGEYDGFSALWDLSGEVGGHLNVQVFPC